MSVSVLIKKYPNRRLYDTEKSTYVTLDQVGEMIKNGRTIEVVDAKTNEDVTGFILNQIILEASKKHVMLPVSLLHLIIRYGDNLLSEFFDQYLEETLKIYLNSKIAFNNHFRQWLKMGIDFPGMEKNIANMQNMFNFYQVEADGTKKNIKADEDDEP